MSRTVIKHQGRSTQVTLFVALFMLLGLSAVAIEPDTLDAQLFGGLSVYMLILHLTEPMLYFALGVTAMFGLSRIKKRSSILVSEDKALYQRIASHTNQVIVIVDKNDHIVFMNSIGEKVIGKRKEDKKRAFSKRFEDQGDYQLFRGLNSNYFVRVFKETIEFKGDSADIYYLEDLSEEVSIQKDLKQQVYKDTLTNLPNRRKLLVDFSQDLTHYVSSQKEAVFVILDFDNFKGINDQYGHDYGDQVLERVAKIFRKYSNHLLTFYRLGGDEFALLAKMPRPEVIKILNTIRHEVEATDYRGITLSFSYGTATMKHDDETRRFSDYYSKADQRLYHHKDA